MARLRNTHTTVVHMDSSVLCCDSRYVAEPRGQTKGGTGAFFSDVKYQLHFLNAHILESIQFIDTHNVYKYFNKDSLSP